MRGAKIKICGLRRIEDIEAVNGAMPDYIGFVFAKSKRQIDMETAAKLKKRLDKRILAIGVFVNQPVDFIAELYQKGVIEIAQLHGEEDDKYICELRKVCDCKIIKAVGIAKELPDLPKSADYLLFDTLSTQRGGTGETFDWKVLENYTGIPYFLAGGLSPENVSDALHCLAPFAVDVSSGVEMDGCKDAERINEFVQSVRQCSLSHEK